MTSSLTANVLAVFNGASADCMRSGLVWYPNARRFAQTLDTNVERAVGIVAAISPNTSWSANKTLALKVYANMSGEGVGFANKVTKVNRMLAGEAPLDVLGGNKVRAFYSSILNPTDPDNTPVIDRHAFDIANGFRGTEKTRGSLSRKGEYERYADAYREAAHFVGIGAGQIQAITWETWREAHSINV